MGGKTQGAPERGERVSTAALLSPRSGAGQLATGTHGSRRGLCCFALRAWCFGCGYAALRGGQFWPQPASAGFRCCPARPATSRLPYFSTPSPICSGAFVYWGTHFNNMKKLLLFLAGAAALSAAPALLGGPFVVNVTRNTATVVWIVKSDELTLHPPAGAVLRVTFT